MTAIKKPAELIINSSSMVKPHQRYTAWGVTLFFWGALLYLWQPLISMVAWAFNIKLFYNHMVILGGYKTFFQAFIYYSIAIAILGGALLLWAKINELRFKTANKRNLSPSPSPTETAKAFGTTVEQIAQAQQNQISRVTLNSTGGLDSIERIEPNRAQIEEL